MSIRTFSMMLGIVLAAAPAFAADNGGNPDYDYFEVSNTASSCDVCGEDTCGCEEDVCCDDSCGCCDSKLLGFISPSAGCFEDFVSPMTNPLYFEDPRNLSEVRFIFAHHDVPNNVLGGGEVQYLAAQIRVALTERLSIIAVKDGFLWGQPDVAPDGWADVTAGLKYTLISNPCSQFILSGGLTYEIPVGSTRALQGNGDGDITMFLSSAKQIGCNFHWMGAFGYRKALDDATGTDMLYFSNHLDYQLTDCWYPFIEANWFNWTSSGNGALSGLEGNDLYNLGSQDVTGNDIVTMGWGVKYKPTDCLEVGVAYEIPLTERRDLLESRLTADLILRY